MNQWNTGGGTEQFPPMMFDASQHSTEWGGGGAFLPIEGQPEVGWLVAIKGDNGMKPAKSGAGWYREIVLVGMEGPINGNEFAWRWNVLNDNQTTVEITNNQIAALCNVLGVGRFNQPMELAGKPFRLVAEKQKGENPQGWTQLAQKGIRDVNGNIPGRGTGAQRHRTRIRPAWATAARWPAVYTAGTAAPARTTGAAYGTTGTMGAPATATAARPGAEATAAMDSGARARRPRPCRS